MHGFLRLSEDLILYLQPVEKAWPTTGPTGDDRLQAKMMGLQFVIIDFAVSQTDSSGLLGYDFAYEDARVVIIAGAFAFQCDRKFFDNR